MMDYIKKEFDGFNVYNENENNTFIHISIENEDGFYVVEGKNLSVLSGLWGFQLLRVEKEIVIKVEGMMCAGCENRVKKDKFAFYRQNLAQPHVTDTTYR